MKELYTKAEAIAAIKKAPPGSGFALHIRNDAPIVDNPGHVYPGGFTTYLDISRAAALKIIERAASETLEKRGARIPLNIRKSEYSEKITYWLL